MKTVDVGAVLDEGEWSGYQKLLVFATALTIILDGLDNQIIGVAIPPMMREWNLGRPAFAGVLTSGMIGMMVGGFLGGFIGDRLGRRTALLGSVLVFGVLTVIISFATSVPMLTVLRFLSGLGLGGAMPNAAAISSEYVPRRQRPFAVTLTVVCIPLGGSLAGLVGGWVLPAFGWRALFLIAGAVPLILAAVLVKLLPESPRYMARHRERWPELRAMMQRLGHDVPGDAAFVDATETAVARASVGELFVPEFRRDTLALGASFFFCLLSAYMGTNWVPAMLARSGFDVGTASYGLTAFNFGGVVGANRRGRRHHAARLAPVDVDDGGRGHRRRDRVDRDVDRAASKRGRVHDAGLDRRSHQRRADDDVRLGGARLSHVDPRDRRRHCGRIRPHWWGGQPDARLLGARVGRRVQIFRDHRRHDDAGLRGAGVGAQSHSASVTPQFRFQRSDFRFQSQSEI
jgi:MFS family permease